MGLEIFSDEITYTHSYEHHPPNEQFAREIFILISQAITKFELPLPENISVLEVGAGTGFYGRWIAEMLEAQRFFPVDINPRTIKHPLSKSQHLSTLWAQARAQELPFSPGFFHLILSKDMIPHLTNPGDLQYFLKEVYRVLHPQGVACLIWHETARADGQKSIPLEEVILLSLKQIGFQEALFTNFTPSQEDWYLNSFNQSRPRAILFLTKR